MTQGTCSIIILNIQTGETNMTTLDIRTNNSPITSITFADGEWDWGCTITVKQHQRDVTELFLRDMDGDATNCLNLSDIDNLILALQKAKELWGNK